MRFINAVLVVLLVVLQLNLWVGEGSIGHYVELTKKIEQLQAHNQTLKTRNEALALEVYRLQNGYDVIESYARTELGMIKANETFYLVVNP